MDKVKLLLVEDDPNLGTILNEYLEAKGFDTTLCKNGEEGYEAFTKDQYRICVFDVMMPIKDGFTLAKEIRRINQEVPIVFLTAKSMKEDTITGFNLGADDYIKKPFSMEELMLRLKAILRRTEGQHAESQKEEYEIGSFAFNKQTQILKSNVSEKKLTSKENDLLFLLCQNMNNVLDRTYALKKVWGDDSYFNSRSMDVYITKLRKYLREDDAIEIINVHGKGFKLLIKS
jgi:two-component system OmpR family response regulator